MKNKIKYRIKFSVFVRVLIKNILINNIYLVVVNFDIYLGWFVKFD